MLVRHRRFLHLTLGALSLIGAGGAPASESHDEAKRLREAGAILPLERILERVRTDRPGRIIETELERKKDRYLYEIKIVDERGQVWELKYDALSGELMREKRKK